jgi:hypothetical protein
MDKDGLGELEGKPYWWPNSQKLMEALDALDARCQEIGIRGIAFIGIDYTQSGSFFVPMASMSDAEAKSLTEKVLPVVVEALQEGGDARKKKLM